MRGTCPLFIEYCEVALQLRGSAGFTPASQPGAAAHRARKSCELEKSNSFTAKTRRRRDSPIILRVSAPTRWIVRMYVQAARVSTAELRFRIIANAFECGLEF